MQEIETLTEALRIKSKDVEDLSAALARASAFMGSEAADLAEHERSVPQRELAGLPSLFNILSARRFVMFAEYGWELAGTSGHSVSHWRIVRAGLHRLFKGC